MNVPFFGTDLKLVPSACLSVFNYFTVNYGHSRSKHCQQEDAADRQHLKCPVWRTET